ncbi:DNA mismatch repair protein MutS [Bengtsoniella intestinalis]|uniref:DNA mismatch repair protein MutS n=1 Tax=Bengtsoniella intestinalis TaxID=3073143 RepID=UPI00391F7DBC
MAAITPMMKQYLEIKAQNPDSILFFRLGDFYEMFNDDARTASEELELTLTTRDKDATKTEAEKTPMCGIPYHASDAYIARLIAKGYKVAICEQVEDPATAKGLVRRDVIRVVTPGTVMDGATLEEKRSSFLCAIHRGVDTAGVSFCDLSTGQVHVTGFVGKEAVSGLCRELGHFEPAEALLNQTAWDDASIRDFLQDKLSCSGELAQGFEMSAAYETIVAQFGEEGHNQMPMDNPSVALSLTGLLHYLHQTQKTDLSHVNQLNYYQGGHFLALDLSARRSLELTETLRSREKKGSLLWVLDKTKTPMGGRLMRSWLEQPLRNIAAISKRSGAVEDLVGNTVSREELASAMTGMGDLERLVGRVAYGNARGGDLIALASGLERLPVIAQWIAGFTTGRVGELSQGLDVCADVCQDIQATLDEKQPLTIREGKMIKKGFDPEVDRLRDLLDGGTNLTMEIEGREKEATGIRTLKVRYNRVFGYYIEVPKASIDLVPETYIRKQTTANAERYITQELKEVESAILTAKDRVVTLEGALFEQLRQRVMTQVRRIQDSAAQVAELDVYTALARVAVANQYCRPTVDESGTIDIHQGRHPVVEQMLRDSLFVPNDTFMGKTDQRCAIITGPNMAGKSTYMRQVALMVLMAQMGSFVPASSACIGVVDRIFTRIGASDDLTAGQSTFMVEMSEVAQMLREATRDSLLILDEIGRGTSTYDGMAIARAVVEHCANPKTLGAKTLFATHYHELTDLEHTLPGTANFSVAVKTRGDDIVFLRKIISGGADRSYGIEVAKLAGLPKDMIGRAKTILADLEAENGIQSTVVVADDQLDMTALQGASIVEQLRRTQVDTLTPVEALNLLYQWKQGL